MMLTDPKGFEAALIAASSLLRSSGASLVADHVKRIASVFGASPEKTSAGTLKKLGATAPSSDATSEIAVVVGKLREVQKFAECVGGNKFSSMLATLNEVLACHGSSSVEAFVAAAIATLNAPKSTGKKPPKPVAPTRDDVVRAFLKKLEESLGEEGFSTIYKMLEDLKQATNEEVLSISQRFTGEKPKSRRKALQAIWRRHHTLMTFRAKSEARAGRSAA